MTTDEIETRLDQHDNDMAKVFKTLKGADDIMSGMVNRIGCLEEELAECKQILNEINNHAFRQHERLTALEIKLNQ